MTVPAHPRKLCLFGALSLADLALTWFLLERGEGFTCESNAVAAWCLSSFGWPGLAGFKLGTVLLVAALALVVARRRPRAAGRVLTFACAALLAVVLYSGSLVSGVEAEASQLDQVKDRARTLNQEFVQRQPYAALLERLVCDLLARRCTLADAVASLADTEYVRGGRWMRSIGPAFPGGSLHERLGGVLVNRALGDIETVPGGAPELARDLEAQFHSCFGHPLPSPPAPSEVIEEPALGLD